MRAIERLVHRPVRVARPRDSRSASGLGTLARYRAFDVNCDVLSQCNIADIGSVRTLYSAASGYCGLYGIPGAGSRQRRPIAKPVSRRTGVVRPMFRRLADRADLPIAGSGIEVHDAEIGFDGVVAHTRGSAPRVATVRERPVVRRGDGIPPVHAGGGCLGITLRF